ncbi:hypothetical protein KJ039_12890 [bacterium]|nr:hypothetical protein [bacterium]
MKRLTCFMMAVISACFWTAGTSEAIDTYTVGDAATGIASSRHNLGATGFFTMTGNTTEICVFCHTPHHSNRENGIKPLWNRYSANSASFVAYGPTMGEEFVGVTSIGSSSLACLSCHDGVVTFDNLVNAPGKGGVTLPGTDRGWSFFSPSGQTADYITDPALNIGRDLSNDHPISVPYTEFTAGLRPMDTVISDIDLADGLNTGALQFDRGNLDRNLWAVMGYISDTATIQDLLRVTDGQWRVECTSCHDPHFNNKSWTEIDYTYGPGGVQNLRFESNGLFLRRVGGNSGSGVCRTCHQK